MSEVLWPAQLDLCLLQDFVFSNPYFLMRREKLVPFLFKCPVMLETADCFPRPAAPYLQGSAAYHGHFFPFN